MKKFLIGALMALAVFGFGVTSEACCGGNYYCAQQDCDNYDGEYCGRYGCGR